MSNWKDFFYFTKGQRIGIIVLISLVVLVIGINILLPIFFPVTTDTLAFPEKTEFFKEEQSPPSLVDKKQSKDYELFTFNPNTADSITFRKLGLNAWTTSNIIKYRNKGGKFRKPDDFKKIYGLSEEKFKELRPYIEIKNNPIP